MKLLNQMLESAKLKDKELRLEKDIVKEDKGKDGEFTLVGSDGLEGNVLGSRYETSGRVH